MADNGNQYGVKRFLMLLAVIALIVGLVFHIIFLVSDNSEDSPQDLYNREQAKLFFLAAIALATISCCWEGFSLCATL